MFSWSNILTRKSFLPKFICFTYPKLYKAALKPSNFLISFEYRIYIYYLQLECPRQLFVWFFPVLFHAHQFDCKQLWIGKHLDQLDMYWPEIIFSKLTMVFCYQNCSDLLREKIVLVIEKNFWSSRLKAKNMQHFWDH